MSERETPQTLIDIDFLPRKYREENARRKVHGWRVAVVGAIAGMVLIAAVLQYRKRLALEAELALVDRHFTAAEADLARLGELQGRLVEVETEAELITFLGHPWPRSRILAAVVDPLPESIRMDEIRLGYEARPQTPAGARREAPSRKEEKEAEEKLHPAQRDLKTLRESAAKRIAVVTLEGTTRDVAALYEYLRRVAAGRLIEKAELSSHERIGGDDAEWSQFQARLVIRAPYGCPDGSKSPTRGSVALANGKL
jgi:hypothetical protein